MPETPPSMALIAAAVGVSRMTVSRVMRNTPSVNPALRRRVLAAASRLGYKPDPKLTEFMRYIRQRRFRERHEVIAFVLCERDVRDPKESVTVRRFLAGVTQRTRELGYGLERFVLAPGVMSAERLAHIFRARGIRAAVLCNVWAAEPGIEVLLRDIVSCIGGTARPELRTHRASSNHYFTIQLALRELRARRYRRIGLYLDAETDTNLQHCWRAGLADHLYEHGLDLASLLNVVETWDERNFMAWVRKARPEAVLTLHRPVAEWVNRAGQRGRLAVALLDRPPGEKEVAGIDQNGEAIGIAAVDLVAARLLNHDTGLPGFPHFVTVEGTWVDGPSVPSRTSSAGKIA